MIAYYILDRFAGFLMAIGPAIALGLSLLGILRPPAKKGFPGTFYWVTLGWLIVALVAAEMISVNSLYWAIMDTIHSPHLFYPKGVPRPPWDPIVTWWNIAWVFPFPALILIITANTFWGLGQVKHLLPSAPEEERIIALELITRRMWFVLLGVAALVTALSVDMFRGHIPPFPALWQPWVQFQK